MMKFGKIAADGAIWTVYPAETGVVKTVCGRTYREQEVVWLPPVCPHTIFAIGLNDAEHAEELSFQVPDVPLIFLKSRGALVGHRGLTERPSGVKEMHPECELAVIIGKSGKNIPKEEAYEYISGYTVANDYAVRDFLENYYRPNLQAKSRECSTPFGPWFIPRSEIKHPLRLNMRTTINGEVAQEGNTKNMIFSIPEIISYISETVTLVPGDVILTGTPKGKSYVEPGDVVVTEIEKIGRLENTIVEGV